MTNVIPENYANAQIGIENQLNSHVDSISIAFAVENDPPQLFNIFAVLEAALPDLAQDMHATYSMVDVRLTLPDGFGGLGSFTRPFSEPIGGGASGELMDPRIACIYNKRTPVLGRKGRGRFYLPGVTDDEVLETGRIDPDRLIDRNNHAASFFTKLVEPEGDLDATEPVLLHAEEDFVPTVISFFDCTALIARLRRRL